MLIKFFTHYFQNTLAKINKKKTAARGNTLVVDFDFHKADGIDVLHVEFAHDGIDLSLSV